MKQTVFRCVLGVTLALSIFAVRETHGHARAEARAGTDLKILAVTVLTSYDDDDLHAIGRQMLPDCAIHVVDGELHTLLGEVSDVQDGLSGDLEALVGCPLDECGNRRRLLEAFPADGLEAPETVGADPDAVYRLMRLLASRGVFTQQRNKTLRTRPHG